MVKAVHAYTLNIKATVIHSPHNRALLCALLLMCFIGTSSNAYAQDNASRGQSFYSQAISLYSKSRYKEAVKAFDQAIEADPLPLYYCNKAVALTKLKEFGKAVETITICRDNFKGPPEELAKIDARLKGLRAVTINLSTSAQASAQNIDARVRRDATIKPPPFPAQDSWGAQDYGLVSMGLGGALLTGALVLDMASKSTVEDFENAPNKAEFDEKKEDLTLRRNIFYALGGAGTLFTLTGIGLFAYGNLSETSAQALPNVSVSPQSVHVQWTLMF